MIRWVLGGLALGVLAAVILVMAVSLATGSSTDVTDLEVGDCFDLDPETEGDVAEITLVDVVDCDEPHNSQVLAVGDLNAGRDRAYPHDDELFAETDAACRAAVADADDERFGVVPIAPSEATWEARRGRYVCVAVSYGGALVRGDHAAVAG